jgi:hypothetical protein
MNAVSSFSNSGSCQLLHYDVDGSGRTLVYLPFLQIDEVWVGPSMRSEGVSLRREIPDRLRPIVDTPVVLALPCQP